MWSQTEDILSVAKTYFEKYIWISFFLFPAVKCIEFSLKIKMVTYKIVLVAQAFTGVVMNLLLMLTGIWWLNPLVVLIFQLTSDVYIEAVKIMELKMICFMCGPW